MVDFDRSDIVASSALERGVERVQALQAVDLGEIQHFVAVAGTPDSSYLASMIDVPGHHGDSDGGLESVNMPVPISPRGMIEWISLERSP